MIRLATLEDVPTLLDMGIHFWRLSPYAAMMTENPDQMTQLLQLLIEGPNAVVLVSHRDGVISGMIGLTVYNHFLSGQVTAAEVFYWTNEDARGTGVRLFHAAELWAKSRGAELMQFGSPSERVDRFYTRLGYQPIERTFQRLLS